MERSAPFFIRRWISTVGTHIKDVHVVFCVFNSVVYKAVQDKGIDNVYVQLSLTSKTYDERKNITQYSIPKLYTGSLANNGVFNIMTAIITLDKGVVQSISWDDNCNTCLKNCLDNSVLKNGTDLVLITDNTANYNVYSGKNCYNERADCDKEGANCDLQIYLVWSGSDSKGRVFESSNVRMTRFQSGSIESIIHTL